MAHGSTTIALDPPSELVPVWQLVTREVISFCHSVDYDTLPSDHSCRAMELAAPGDVRLRAIEMGDEPKGVFTQWASTLGGNNRNISL